MGDNRTMMLHPSAPLAAIRAKLDQGVRVQFDPGFYPAAAAAIARQADIAIVFAIQWMTEGLDAPDLSLPQGQDATIAAVAAANARTIVVLETGGPVLMPWLDRVAGVLEAWYPGARGGDAIADVLFGDVNPSGHLPITFPAALAQLPRPTLDDTSDEARLAGSQSHALRRFDVNYNIEGADVGYRWYARQRLRPLFAFGYGLSYTSFTYSDIQLTGGKSVSVSFTVTNRGARAGKDVPQVYVTSRAGTPGQRLIGWSNVELEPGASRRVTVRADPRLLAGWSMADHGWKLLAGSYEIKIGSSADALEPAGAARVAGDIIR